MYIKQLIGSIEKRPKMFVQEEKIEYIFRYISGYCSACHNFSVEEMDKKFCYWFWKWLIERIKNDSDIEEYPVPMNWCDAIKKLDKNKGNEVRLFYELCVCFFQDYENKENYFMWGKTE